MPTIYSLKGSFGSDTTYRFKCEYCGRDYSVTTTLERQVSLSSLHPPGNEQLVAEAQRVFKGDQDHTKSLGERGHFAVDRRSATCPNCGFVPTYMVNRSQSIFNIALLLIIGVGVSIPLLVVGAMPTSVMVLLGLVLLVPYLLLMWFWVRRLNPNRKLMRILRDEGRSLATAQKPQVEFGPVVQKPLRG